MQTEDIAAEVNRYIDRVGASGQPVWCDLGGLVVVRHDMPTTFEAVLYQPVVCLILQGRKETMIGDRLTALPAPAQDSLTRLSPSL